MSVKYPFPVESFTCTNSFEFVVVPFLIVHIHYILMPILFRLILVLLCDYFRCYIYCIYFLCRRDAWPHPQCVSSRSPKGHLVLRPDQLEEGVYGLPRTWLGTASAPSAFLTSAPPASPQWDPGEPEPVRGHEGAVGSRLERDGAHTSGTSTSTTPSASTRPHSTARKLDIQYKNVYGKEHTLVTIQIDIVARRALGILLDENGEKKLPYIIHRTSLGCYERTLAYLIKEYAGALPTWMAPEQVRFLPVTDRAADYCAEQAKKLEDMGLPRRGRLPQREDRP